VAPNPGTGHANAMKSNSPATGAPYGRGCGPLTPPKFERMYTLSARGGQQVGPLRAGGPDPFGATGSLALLPAASA